MSKEQAIEVTIPESLNMDGLELRGNYRFIGYRQDILHALERKHVAAYIVTALLRWLKPKREDLIRIIKRRAENKLPPLTETELEIWIHMSFEEFADEFDGLFSHNTIKDTILYLINKGVIQQRKNPNPKFRDYEYQLMLPVLRELLRSLPANPAHRPRDNRNRKGNQSPKLVTPPEMVTSPNLANESPKLVDESPKLAKHYTESTQIDHIDNTERKNGSSSEASSNHPSTPSQSSSEVLFTEEEMQVLAIAKKLKLSYLRKNEKNKAHCSKLVSEGVITLEQMKSLMQFCKQRPYLKGRDLNLGNLAGELDSWLQLQSQAMSDQTKISFLASDETSDQNLEKLQARIAAKQKERVKA